MSNVTATIYCPCCGQEKPAWDYAPGLSVCSLCALLTGNDATLKCRATMRIEQNLANASAAGRKAARIADKLRQYAVSGKRCSACHHLKTPDHYHRCKAQSDGLQPVCQECNTIRAAALKSGGLAQWHLIRDAMRASSPEGK